MPRLVVNPGSPQAREIQLKPGINFLGRGASNDFRFDDLSISGAHCQIHVDNSSVTIRDMGSTNGTFVNRAKVQESRLVSGQPVRLGSVDMVFYGDEAVPADAAASAVPPPLTAAPLPVSAPPAPPPPVPVMSAPALKPSGLRVSGLSHEPAPAAVAAPDAPPEAPDLGSQTEIFGTRFCKYHPKSPANHFCRKCSQSFCDLCVTSRNVGGKIVKTCRSCGVECIPVHFQRAASKGFYGSLPGAFIYPFKGAGIIILICATVAFAAIRFVSGGLFGIFIKIALYGFVFLFMQNIIHTTTSDEEETLGFPDPSNLWGAAFQLGMTIVASFWLALGLEIAKLCDVAIPVEAIMASFILGGVYFPMAFLAVAMKDSVMAANPLVVLPAMMKVPVQYMITVVLLLGVFGVRQVGDILSGGAGTISMTTKDMSVLFLSLGFQAMWALISVYLLTVTMRILGLFYNASKEKLGWFSR